MCDKKKRVWCRKCNKYEDLEEKPKYKKKKSKPDLMDIFR